MSSRICCLDMSSHVSEAAPGCDVMLSNTGTRAGLRRCISGYRWSECLPTPVDAPSYFIQENIKHH